jgi:hypothetical protein
MTSRFLFPALAVFGSAAAFSAPPEPAAAALPPTKVTLKQADATLADAAAALAKVSGMTIAVEPDVAKRRCPFAFDGTPLWDALEKAALDADARLVVSDRGRTITFAPRGASQEVSATSGPFRVALRGVTGRLVVEAGTTFHELQLEVHWEPRYPVYRIDTNPKIVAAKFDRGSDLIADPTVARDYPAGSSITTKVRLAGLPRRASKIDVVAGEFRAVAAARLLAFKFDDVTAKAPATRREDRVSATLKPLSFDESTGTWDSELVLEYPTGGPVFESFEEQKWLRDNRARLVSPDGKPHNPDSEEVVIGAAKDRLRVTATYRFKGVNPRAKGWSLVYEAPSPLVEVVVPFKLENIPVP